MPWWHVFFIFGAVRQDFTQIYGQRANFCWFVRKQTAFYGQTDIFRDLSVNFWPLWWEFTDRSLFSEHLSVKSRSKPLKSYGQTAVFDHFVRNRHFWNSPFTDSIPIFIDASVNNSDFAKCSAARQLLNRCTWPRLRAKRSFWNLLVIWDHTALAKVPE